MIRKERVKHYIQLVSQGHPLEEVKSQFRKEFQDVPADEIAEAERLLMEEGMQLSEVQQLCDVHASLFEGAVQQQGAEEPAGHPLFVFSKENEGLTRFVESKLMPAYERWQQDEKANTAELNAALTTLQKIDKHYARKENLFFPYLEQAGVTAPPKVMWGVDDEIREHIKVVLRGLNDGDTVTVASNYPLMLEKLLSMITKEEEILKPLLRRHIKEADWKVIAGESDQIGIAFADGIEGASPSDAKAWATLGTAAPKTRENAPIQLPSGYFQLEELRQVLNTLPCDITFVAADDTVHFFSEQENRVFPRTRTIIGRQVADCHPPKSLKAVEELVQAFKDGKKDSESYWIQRGGKFVLIRYYAIRDERKNYLGVMECTEEISELRSLTGEKTLMS